MSNSSNLIFGTKTNLALAATPSNGSYLVAYDIMTGYLSQKDDKGVISKIGIAPTASGILEVFPSDILLSLQDGKSFGKYVSGDIIPANGKTGVEVIIESLTEPITPSTSLSSLTTIEFNQTAISNVLTYTYSINSLGATAASTLLEFRRNNTGSWTLLSSNINLFTFTHSITDTNFNIEPFNYKYTVTDSLNSMNVTTLDILPGLYATPSITLNVVAATLSYIENNNKREKGNIESNISGLITKNSLLTSLNNYQLQYQKNSTGSWINIGATVSISGTTASILLVNDNNNLLVDSNSILYRVVLKDSYTTITSLPITIDFKNVIFYGPVSATPSNSNSVRLLPNKLFTDGINPLILNTGTIERNFSVSLPTNVSNVIDLDTGSTLITPLYTLSVFNVNDFYGTAVSYKNYTMTNAIPYSFNHKHQITRL